MREQRNFYKGSPLRPWVRLVLVAADGETKEIEALADTGNPCALIVGQALLLQFNVGLAPGMSTNFGALDGGWLRIQIPDFAFDEELLAYPAEDAGIWRRSGELLDSIALTRLANSHGGPSPPGAPTLGRARARSIPAGGRRSQTRRDRAAVSR